ncbi:MAG: hypothetical protein LC737_05035, partial [Chloroflexi bacterium]|nr:hypothetical protein [Chloroflexota bacterium]
ANTSHIVTFAIAVASAAAVAFVLAQSLAHLNDYYAAELQAGRSNEPFLQWCELARPYAQDGYRILLGARLDRESVVPLGSTYGYALGYLLNMHGVTSTVASADELRAQIQNEPETKRLLLLERTGEFARLRTLLPLCVVSGLPGRVMATYTGAPCQ